MLSLLPVVALMVAAVAYDQVSRSHFFPRTSIGGVHVGGRAVEDARAILHERLIEPLQEPVSLTGPEFEESVPAWELGLRIDLDDAIADAHEQQRQTPLLRRAWSRVAAAGGDYSLRPHVDSERLRAFLTGAASRIDREVRDATVAVDGPALEVVPHQLGRRLDVAGAERRIVRALGQGSRSIPLPIAVTEPELRSEDFDRVVLVRTGSKGLDLYLEGELSKTYPVAVGKPGYSTPQGQFKITAMRRNPTWGNPGSPWAANMPRFIGPGPNNPLGTRAMNLSARGIRIHGTPEPHTIGTAASHGCIRMYMRDAEELFEIVDVGTPVLIVGA